MKEEINSNTEIMGDFNSPLTPGDRSSRQKTNKETAPLYNTLEQLVLIDIFRTFHFKAAEYTFLSSTHVTFSQRDHIVGHKKVSVNIRRLKSYQASSPTVMV